MIKVVVGNNAHRESLLVPSATTLRDALERGGIDYTQGVIHLDGSTINPGDLNRTFGELGYDGTEGRDKCFLLNVVKTDNA